MSAQSHNDLRAFQRFLSEKLDNGGSFLSPEEVLDEWRLLHPNPDAAEEEAAAIQQAVDDLDNGDTGTPFDEFDRSFRARHQLPPAP